MGRDPMSEEAEKEDEVTSRSRDLRQNEETKERQPPQHASSFQPSTSQHQDPGDENFSKRSTQEFADNLRLLAQATPLTLTDPPLPADQQTRLDNRLSILSIASTSSESAFLPSFSLTTTSYLTQAGAGAQQSKTPSLSLSFRKITSETFAATFASTNVRQRLALMLRMPWASLSQPSKLASAASSLMLNNVDSQALARNRLFVSSLGLGIGLGVATFSCLGCYCVARLILPQTRVYLVCLRTSLAQLVATCSRLPPLAALSQLGASLRAVVLFVREPRSIEATTGDGCEPHNERLLLTAGPNNTTQNNFTTPVHSLTQNNHDFLTDTQIQSLSSPDFFRGGRRRQRRELVRTPTAAELADDERDELQDEELRDVMTDESIWSRRTSPRRLTLTHPVSVDDILNAGGPNSPIHPIPLERIGDSPLTFNAPSSATLTNDDFITSPTREPANFSTDRLSKRLSLNFPIQPATNRPSRPPSWHASPILSPEVLAAPTEGNFLTVLAHQERRVLELTEELRRAEQELNKLKKRWASQEMYKKRQESRRGLQLKPLDTSFPLVDVSDDDVDGSQQWLQREMERRKSLMSGVRSSGRKVFSGSKHTRTLSLLSPDKGTASEPFRMTSPRKKPPARIPPAPKSALERSSTQPDMSSGIFSPTKDDIFSNVDGLPKEAILRTGKQMATDIKEGLWTFFEDIRQATVGDEAINARMLNNNNTPTHGLARSNTQTSTHNKKLARHSTALITSQPRANSSMTYDPLLDASIQGAFWRDYGLGISSDTENQPSTRPSQARQDSANSIKPVRKSAIPTPQKPKDIEDSWDSWGTPIKPADNTPTPKSHIKSPSSSSSEPPSHDGSRPNSPLNTLTPQTLTPQSASASQRVSAIEPLNGLDGILASGTASKRSSGVWATNLAKMPVEQFKRTASQIMADWERAVAAEEKNHHATTSP
ncbi:hypothetical protein BT63DRAFT_410773 [Microthyrium microscopicum]|uniref:DUF4048 domain-containing protein n=1 Tax=Microthyrium microscopicum TaxID=703497 RepID=A0A6A6UQ12_9PEZI|nr:hypothetical protein BT63DRAFT_410773 [Microthyrium microscopicum]